MPSSDKTFSPSANRPQLIECLETKQRLLWLPSPCFKLCYLVTLFYINLFDVESNSQNKIAHIHSGNYAIRCSNRCKRSDVLQHLEWLILGDLITNAYLKVN